MAVQPVSCASQTLTDRCDGSPTVTGVPPGCPTPGYRVRVDAVAERGGASTGLSGPPGHAWFAGVRASRTGPCSLLLAPRLGSPAHGSQASGTPAERR